MVQGTKFPGAPIITMGLLILHMQLCMWLRDILEELCRQKLRDITDFEWQKYMRPYLVPGEGEGDSSGSTASIVLQCLDQRLSYGFEYQGSASLPVMTPGMENYILAFTQVIILCTLLVYVRAQRSIVHHVLALLKEENCHH